MNEQISGGAIRACDIRSAPNVLITGAGRRIGAAIALDLARHGYGVAIHSHRSQQEAENLARRIIEQGGRALQVAGDLLNPQGLRAIVTEAGNALGPITLLINNASIFEPDGIGSLDIDRFDRHFAIHTPRAAVSFGSLRRATSGGRPWTGGQYHRSARLATDATFSQLRHVEIRTLGPDANAGASACADGAGQCHRPRPDPGQRTAIREGLPETGAIRSSRSWSRT